MGEEVRGVPEAAPLGGGLESQSVPDPDEDASIGRYLARQRQLREISLEQLASLTKIPRRSLERLESGAFDRSPDGFARGFVRTVAAALGLDPDDAVMRLMQEPPDEESATAGLRPGFGSAPAVLAGLLALSLLVGLVWVVLGREADPAPAPAAAVPEIVLREDPVRTLAREQADQDGPAAPREGPREEGATASAP